MLLMGQGAILAAKFSRDTTIFLRENLRVRSHTSSHAKDLRASRPFWPLHRLGRVRDLSRSTRRGEHSEEITGISARECADASCMQHLHCLHTAEACCVRASDDRSMSGGVGAAEHLSARQGLFPAKACLCAYASSLLHGSMEDACLHAAEQ